MKQLEGKTAFITGGSRGIGAAIAQRLAQEGAKVAITYKASPEKAAGVVDAIEAQKGQAIAIRADSADPGAIVNAVERTVQELGGLDILVNNAGIGVYKDIGAFTIDDFDEIVAVNIRAVFTAVTAALPYLKRGSRIITIGSCQAERMPGPGGALYAMSKSALVGFTKGIARDLGPKGITANLVHPGPVDTDMNPEDGPTADFQRSLMALDAFGTGDEVAGLVAYLARPEAGYITGSGFLIDGGTNI
ncbi:3-oxoacyl-ACP reductase FabG [Niabella sp. CC-SYL272]|uniref:SDR family NAD(P)-dependent oxidoreductase n=1 Tax=Niabella agricola TaxID=2891571 RepID=UPI001F2EC302|nr:3-oxoacyl-ACP reductase family protein [Niabella agricola]MCF3111128.1 3-oxoacyl-ACP reductase FabG [Niabella agricola]